MTQTAQTSASTSNASNTSDDYAKTIRVKATPEALFDALTTASGLSAWWAPAKGSCLAGDEITFTMNADDPLLMRVDEATPASVQWTVTACDFVPDWVGTRPTFTMTPVAPGETELHFRHEGLTPDLDCIEMCRSGWNHFIPSLARYAESGLGMPLGSSEDQARRR